MALHSMENDVLVLDQVVAMQRLADCARRGYCWHVSGTVPLRRALPMIEKFQALYDVNAHRNTRWRHRRRGVAGAVLIVYRMMDAGIVAGTAGDTPCERLQWTLLLTDGSSRARHLEALQRVTDTRNTLRVGRYEMVRRTRAGQAHPAWSYRMTSSVYADYRERVIKSARGDPREPVALLLKELYTQPGFAGIRSQIGQIVSLFRREYRRRHRRGERFPSLPRLGYVQRLATSGTPLRDLVVATGKTEAARCR